VRQLLQRAGARAAALILASAALLAGAAGCDRGPTDTSGKDGSPRAASADSIHVTPRDGAKGVGRDAGIRVTVPEGRLERVAVRQIEAADPVDLPGRISPDGKTWTPVPGAHPALAAKYGVDAVTLDDEGRRAARHTSFTTEVPAHRFIGYFAPENRATVGTGMIVSVDFNRRIRDRAAVQRAITVTAEPAVEVVGHWFGDRRLDFRPRDYWTPGTRVTIAMALRDVQAAPGVYGIQHKTVTFTVGRSQVSTVDAASHTMRVHGEGGRLLATLPVTAGAPGRTTYNGRMVVSEMYDVTRMNGSTVGFGGEYDIKDVPHALRLTTSGTFLHGNYWASPDTFGSRNTSHGCVGLRDVKGGSSSTPAGWFFDRTLVGDVVEVVHSEDRTVSPDNGLSGWNLNWSAWREGSAA
jgi:lipoprotein-anchoring transpeptidase ErfK/SrfK